MKKWFLVVLSTVLVACGPEARQTLAADEVVSMNVDGHARHYLLHTPASYRSNKSVPLVLVLHGGQGDGAKVSAQTGFNGVSDREGFVVAYPSSITKKTPWYDGRDATKSGIDDVSFIEAVVHNIESKRNIDSSRVYVTGASAGGAMTQHLACERAGLFTAYASVVANMSVSLSKKCKPSKPVAMLLINSKDDPIMPWPGGEIKKSRRMGNGGTVMSVADTIEFWRRNSQCNAHAKAVLLPDRDPSDGTRVSRQRYTGCIKNAEVELISEQGAGHSWPGSPQRSSWLKKRILGTTSRDIVASDVIWSFFDAHR